MKYSQFLELQEKLDQKGYTLNDLEETLNEGTDPNILLLEFWGMKSALFRTGLLGKSRKLKAYFAKTLKGMENDVKGKLKTYTDKIIKIKNERFPELKNIQKSGKPIPEQSIKQLMEIESKIIKIVNGLVEKFSDLKTREVKAKLDSVKMSDKTRAKLETTWESLLSDFKIELLTALYNSRIIETDASVKFIKKLRAESESNVKSVLSNDKVEKDNKGDQSSQKKSKDTNDSDSADGDVKGEEL